MEIDNSPCINSSDDITITTVPCYSAGSVAPSATVVTTVTGAGGGVWMDRNLGASQVATSSTDANSYGALFQWGRLSDGHEDRGSSNTTTLSSSDEPCHDDFITNSASPYDWRSPANDNLWQGSKRH